MTDLELIFNMLGEASTTEITRTRDAQGFVENLGAARKGGEIAGGARQKLEQETGKSVVSSDNYLEIAGKVKKLGNSSISNIRKKKLKNKRPDNGYYNDATKKLTRKKNNRLKYNKNEFYK